MLDAPDLVNHPPHYTSGPACRYCGWTIECIDVTENMSFTLGNVVKYIWRCDNKGDAIENLEKALWYLVREIAKRKRLAAKGTAKHDRSHTA